MENIVLKASDGYALSLAVFESEHPRGYIQIIHGMEEHKERYEAFAEQAAAGGIYGGDIGHAGAWGTCSKAGVL